MSGNVAATQAAHTIAVNFNVPFIDTVIACLIPRDYQLLRVRFAKKIAYAVSIHFSRTRRARVHSIKEMTLERYDIIYHAHSACK
jgi:hypothetical protein